MLHVVDRSRSLLSMRMRTQISSTICLCTPLETNRYQTHIQQVYIHVHAHVDADRFACQTFLFETRRQTRHQIYCTITKGTEVCPKRRIFISSSVLGF